MVRKNKKCGFIDTSGREVIPCQFYMAGSFNNGYALTRNRARGRTLIDKTGRAVAWRPISQKLQCDDGLRLIARGNLFGLADRSGRWFARPFFKHIGMFDGTM